MSIAEAIDGGCTCRLVRYRMSTPPMIVHCCHCRWCQRETGAAFALNAMIEADRVKLLEGDVEVVMTPSARANDGLTRSATEPSIVIAGEKYECPLLSV